MRVEVPFRMQRAIGRPLMKSHRVWKWRAENLVIRCCRAPQCVSQLPLLGVIHDPMRQETFAATSDGPATLNGRAIRASVKESMSDFVVSMALSGRAALGRSRTVRKAIRVPRSMGSAALALAYVGNGRFDAFVQQGGLSSWDIAAAGLIAERGGARVTDLDGGSWFDLARGPQSIGVLAAPSAHHARLLAITRG